MTPERWRQIEGVYGDALELEGQARQEFIDRACAGDHELRNEVESLIAAHEQAGHFITTPAMDMVARQIADHHSQRESQKEAQPGETRGFASATDPFSFSTFGAPAGPSLAPETILGDRYLVERELGRGGVGEVFLARDRKLLNTPVVVKIMREQIRDSTHRVWFERKFKEEIAALSRIDHPGVVRALDVGDLPDGRAYFVMQYVPGVSLRSVLSSNGLDFGQVANLVRQMGQALTAAHKQGVVHRDLKPENIMLQPSDDGEYVKLIDFGIATVIDDANASGVTTTTIIGTREYMAPEQLMGKPTAASDIYALGIVAYEMLTGHRPFNEVNVTDLYEAQRDANFARPRSLRPELPQAAEDAILKALRFDPEKRFAQAKDFTETLACALTGEVQYSPQRIHPLTQQTVVAESPRRTELWLAIAGVLVIVLGAGIAIWWRLQPLASQSGVKSSQSTTTALLPERELSYSLTVRKDPSRYPKSNPFILPGEIIFEAGYQVRLNISSPQSGYLYVINEGPNRKDGLPEMNLLFPEVQRTPTEIRAIQSIQIPPSSDNPELDWFIFDRDEGVEKVWMIWASHPVPEIEAVKHVANPQDKGEISAPDEIRAVADYLNQHSANKAKPEKDDANTLTRLKARGDVLVGLVRLEHH